MQTQVIPIQKFLGLMTQYDEVAIPLGGVLSCSSLAMYLPDRIQRIPGIQDVINVANASGGFPIAWRQRISGTEYLMTSIVDGNNNAKIWNVTSAAEVTGTTSLTNAGTGLLANVWSTTVAPSNGKQIVANGTQAIQQIDSATTRSDYTGTNVPIARLVKAYLGRLFCVDTDSYLVKFSTSLGTDFTGLTLQIDEVPGQVLGIAINSVTSAGGTIETELVFGKQTGIVKLNGDPTVSSSTKSAVSSEIGWTAPHTFVNTKAGGLFLGTENNRFSIYFLPLGSQGEPKDVGQALETILNGSTALADINLSRAISHDGFYKLFIKRGSDLVEVWGDIRTFIRTGEIQWYGIHKRKCRQSPVVLQDGTLNLFEVISGQGKHLRERTDKTQSFTAADQTTLTAELDMPLNVGSSQEEKVFDLLRLYVAKEANVNGNALSVTRYSEGVAQGGTSSVSIFDSTSSQGAKINLPIVGANGASLTGHFARLNMQQTTGSRLDILQMALQYLSESRPKIKEANVHA